MQSIEPEKLWSIEAEAAVIGSMILDSSRIGNILPVLDGNSFYKPEHQVIYDVLINLYTSNNPVDAISLRTELKNTNQLERIGGVDYIVRLLESVPTAANIEYYARVVRDRQKYRDLVRMVGQIQAILHEPFSVDALVQQIQDTALGFGKSDVSTEYFTMAEHAEKVEAEAKEQTVVIPTGLRNIDRIVGGVAAGEFIILAGRPAMGKTALALQIALSMAHSGLSLVFFTLEMTHRALIMRALKAEKAASLSKLD